MTCDWHGPKGTQSWRTQSARFRGHCLSVVHLLSQYASISSWVGSVIVGERFPTKFWPIEVRFVHFHTEDYCFCCWLLLYILYAAATLEINFWPLVLYTDISIITSVYALSYAVQFPSMRCPLLLLLWVRSITLWYQDHQSLRHCGDKLLLSVQNPNVLHTGNIECFIASENEITTGAVPETRNIIHLVSLSERKGCATRY